jgi:hypothetical protein
MVTFGPISASVCVIEMAASFGTPWAHRLLTWIGCGFRCRSRNIVFPVTSLAPRKSTKPSNRFT